MSSGFTAVAGHSYRIWEQFKWVAQSPSSAGHAVGDSWGNPEYVEWAYLWIEPS